MNDEQFIREIATHGAEIKHIQNDLDQIASEMIEVRKALAEINKTLSEAKGGWKILMLIGGASGTIGSFITWVVAHWKG